jgi:hypothetical protein
VRIDHVPTVHHMVDMLDRELAAESLRPHIPVAEVR